MQLTSARTPWYFWVLAALALLWYAGGAFDYWMTVTENQAYLAQLTKAQQDWIMNRPLWFHFAWAISIWSAVLAAILMLLRHRWATPLFALSLLAYLVACLWSYVLAPIKAWEVSGTLGAVMGLVIGISLMFFWLFNRSMQERGVLR